MIKQGVKEMLKIQEVRELIKLIDQSTIEEFKFEQNGSKVTIRKQGKEGNKLTEQPVDMQVSQPAPQVVTVEATPETKQEAISDRKKEEIEKKDTDDHKGYYTITSPMVGTFYAAPSPESPPYVKVGDKVTDETVVCIVEAMKLMNEIEAEVKGEIVEILVENGQLVEYGQELFLVKPE